MYRVGGIFRFGRKFENNKNLETHFEGNGINYHKFPFQIATRGSIKYKEVAKVLAEGLVAMDNGNIDSKIFRTNLEELKKAIEETKK